MTVILLGVALCALAVLRFIFVRRSSEHISKRPVDHLYPKTASPVAKAPGDWRSPKPDGVSGGQ
jgi:hypothetical protein